MPADGQRPTLRRLVEPDLKRPVSLSWPSALPRKSAALAVHEMIVELSKTLLDQDGGVSGR